MTQLSPWPGSWLLGSRPGAALRCSALGSGSGGSGLGYQVDGPISTPRFMWSGGAAGREARRPVPTSPRAATRTEGQGWPACDWPRMAHLNITDVLERAARGMLKGRLPNTGYADGLDRGGRCDGRGVHAGTAKAANTLQCGLPVRALMWGVSYSLGLGRQSSRDSRPPGRFIWERGRFCGESFAALRLSLDCKTVGIHRL